MSKEGALPNRDDIRYQVSMDYFKENSYVIYQMGVKDLGLGLDNRVLFRFSDIRKFHQKLVKVLKENRERVPQFPQRNSFAFWNKTNSDPKKIQQRKRQLESYFCKLLNDPLIRSVRLVKKFLQRGSNQLRRSKSAEILTRSSTVLLQRKSLPKKKNPASSLAGTKQLIKF